MQRQPGVPTYDLAPHVFACACAGEVVMLDVRRDKYLSLPTQHSTSLAEWVRDWPVAPIPSASNDPGFPARSDDIQEILEAMCTSGLLVSIAAADAMRSARRGSALSYEWTGEWTGPLYDANSPFLSRNIPRYATAVAAALFVVKRHSLVHIIARAARIRDRRTARCSADDEAVPVLVAQHRYLRPWFFRATNNCILECLVLLEFLALHGRNASWTFGVRTRPFAAHCWIHSSGTILNDTIENVCRFTPIMTV